MVEKLFSLESLLDYVGQAVKGSNKPQEVLDIVCKLMETTQNAVTGTEESIRLQIARGLIAYGMRVINPKTTSNDIGAVISRNGEKAEALYQETLNLKVKTDFQPPLIALSIKPLTPENINTVIRSIPLGTTPDKIIDAVANAYGVRPELMRDPNCRRRHITMSRRFAMYLIRACTPYSLENIGAYFGSLSHTTVRISIEKAARFLKEGPLVGKLPDLQLAEGIKPNNYSRIYLGLRLPELVQKLIKQQDELKIEEILPALARMTGFDLEKCKTSRAQPYPAIWLAAAIVLGERYGMSWNAVSAKLGKHHTTIIYGLEQLESSGVYLRPEKRIKADQ